MASEDIVPFKIQTFYPDAGLFLNTNHVSDDLDELKKFADGDMFAGFRIRIVDDSWVHEPPPRKRSASLSVSDIALMLGAPVVAPDEFFGRDDADA